MFLTEDEMMALETGYTSRDLHDFDITFYTFITNGLKNFVEETDTYPDEYQNLEAWKSHLIDLSEKFHQLTKIYYMGERDPILLHTCLTDLEEVLPHLWY